MFRTLQDFVKGYQQDQLKLKQQSSSPTSVAGSNGSSSSSSDAYEEAVALEIEEIFESLTVEEKKQDGHGEDSSLLPAFVVVNSHDKLWTKTSQVFKLPLEEVEDTALTVVTDLIQCGGSNSGTDGATSEDLDVMKQQFRQFHRAFVLNERGSTEFYTQLMVAICTTNLNKGLERSDIDNLLDVIFGEYKVFQNGLYQQHSFFHSPTELPILPDSKNLMSIKTKLQRKGIMEGRKLLFQDVMKVLKDMAPHDPRSVTKETTTATPVSSTPAPPTSDKKKSSSSGSSNFSKLKKALAKTQQTPGQRESEKIFKLWDKNGDKFLCLKEAGDYVKSNPNMWAMIGVNLNLEDDHCQRIATRVTMELATSSTSSSSTSTTSATDGTTTTPPSKPATTTNASTITKSQFHKFRMKYVQDPRGNQEFFHRCVFATYDTDADTFLNETELDNLLSVFYDMPGSIFAGDARLPATKQELKQQIYNNYNNNNKTSSGIMDGSSKQQQQDDANIHQHYLSFDDVRGLISGHGVFG